MIERQRARAAERGEVPELERTERDALHLLHFVRVGHGGEERRRGARADVAAEADDDVGIEDVVQRKEPAAEKEIRVRAMRDARGALRSIIALPMMPRNPRRSASAKKISVASWWMVEKISAHSVPLCSSSSKNAPAMRRAWSGSANFASVGNV